MVQNMKVEMIHYDKEIKGVPVLNDINLKMESGKIYGLKGKNGSGKTMIMRAVAGLIHPTNGSVLIDEEELGKKITFPPSLGLFLEGPAFLPDETGYENLKLIAGIKKKIRKEEIENAISRVGLEPYDKRKYKKYSLGMKQRLGIACAIMEQPDLLILDEPTNALDKDGVEIICRIIKEEKERGALILMSCHDDNYLYELVDEVIEVQEGKVVK